MLSKETARMQLGRQKFENAVSGTVVSNRDLDEVRWRRKDILEEQKGRRRRGQ